MPTIEQKTFADIEAFGKKHDAMVFSGCGGDLNRWVDGITQMLKNDKIVADDFQFSFVWKFNHPTMSTITCLLFPIDDTDVGKLSIWRIKNINLDVKWLSDFIDQVSESCESDNDEEEIDEDDECEKEGDSDEELHYIRAHKNDEDED
jgi:hypothetical protein